MSSFHKFAAPALLCTLLMGALPASLAQTRLGGIGRTATPAEVKAWDIDVRPDFKGLPAGQGSVKRGEQVWETQCASCHGTFGESNDVFTPLVGYTTRADVESGHVEHVFAACQAGGDMLDVFAEQLDVYHVGNCR